MRQAGICAAAGLHALEHHRARLADDHANARRIAQGLAANPHVDLDLDTVETNIVVFHLARRARRGGGGRARARARRAAARVAERTVRAVTHLDVDAAQCERAAQILAELI